MARSSKQSDKAIQSLLDERRRIEQWLDRLAMTADKAPEDVRTKVERDYRARLEKVLGELEGHRDEIEQTLKQRQEERLELVAKEKESSEELSEAELRHAVGEYDEAEWTKVRTEILESLVKLREDLKAADEEIGGLEEVLASVVGGDKGKAGPEPADVEDEEDEEIPALEDAEAEAEAQGARRPSNQTDAFDELAFLKSVTEDEEKGPRPERASGMAQAITDESADLEEAAPAEEEEEGSKDKKKKKKKKKHQRSVGAAGVTAVEAGPEPSKGTVQRTLKCADCGTMNLPTEWYCENCGAELAAV